MKAQKITIEQLAAAEELIVKHHLAPTVVTDFTVRVNYNGEKVYSKGVYEWQVDYEKGHSWHNTPEALASCFFEGKSCVTKSKQLINCEVALTAAKLAQECGLEFEITYTDNRRLRLF